ncbi:hypothetical protein FAIPA1_20135 [Frankia sp. AiPs1]
MSGRFSWAVGRGYGLIFRVVAVVRGQVRRGFERRSVQGLARRREMSQGLRTMVAGRGVGR